MYLEKRQNKNKTMTMVILPGFSGESDWFLPLGPWGHPFLNALRCFIFLPSTNISPSLPQNSPEFPQNITTVGFVLSFFCHCTRRQNPGPLVIFLDSYRTFDKATLLILHFSCVIFKVWTLVLSILTSQYFSEKQIKYSKEL